MGLVGQVGHGIFTVLFKRDCGREASDGQAVSASDCRSGGYGLKSCWKNN